MLVNDFPYIYILESVYTHNWYVCRVCCRKTVDYTGNRVRVRESYYSVRIVFHRRHIPLKMTRIALGAVCRKKGSSWKKNRKRRRVYCSYIQQWRGKKGRNPSDCSRAVRRGEECRPSGALPRSNRPAENVFKDNKSSPKQLITSRLFVCLVSPNFRSWENGIAQKQK